jgi:RHS repeat-associated protein
MSRGRSLIIISIASSLFAIISIIATSLQTSAAQNGVLLDCTSFQITLQQGSGINAVSVRVDNANPIMKEVTNNKLIFEIADLLKDGKQHTVRWEYRVYDPNGLPEPFIWIQGGSKTISGCGPGASQTPNPTPNPTPTPIPGTTPNPCLNPAPTPTPPPFGSRFATHNCSKIWGALGNAWKPHFPVNFYDYPSPDWDHKKAKLIGSVYVPMSPNFELNIRGLLRDGKPHYIKIYHGYADLGGHFDDRIITGCPVPKDPVGNLDSIDGDGVVTGWAKDPDSECQSISVHFYIDGPTGKGKFIGETLANVNRSDVGSHGFRFIIPSRYQDGQKHTLYVHGIDATGDLNTLISEVPKSFQLSKPTDTSLPSSGSVDQTSDFNNPRLEPRNETGRPGVNAASQNLNWSIPILSLPGRSGLNAGLSLSYNSLVWVKNKPGTAIFFNADNGTPSAGFQLGFPYIQPLFYNTDAKQWSYMMITPSGGRVEFRYTGRAGFYEAVDGSNAQLQSDGSGITVRTADGTQMRFTVPAQGELRCSEIKDRNGNFITIDYSDGVIGLITDTLGRKVRFNYDDSKRLVSITQKVNGQDFFWAKFGYAGIGIQPNFQKLSVYGPTNETVSLLNQVQLPDGTSYIFTYNTWGQVFKITKNAADGQPLSYRSANLPIDSTTTHDDCPRFSEVSDWVKDWNDNKEVRTTFNVDPAGTWNEVIDAEGKIFRQYTETSGWMRGLTTKTEVIVNGQVKKWSTTRWTQDDESLTYKLNPRPVEIVVFDEEGRSKKTRISYTNLGLPENVYEYGPDGAVFRRTEKKYVWDKQYTDRRIIGLVDYESVYDGSDTLLSRVDYSYDSTGSDELLQHQGNPVQHDSSYGLGFTIGRGNLTYVGRQDASDTSRLISTWMGYNTAGSLIWTKDALGKKTITSYSDSFSDGQNRNSLAYPTSLTDPDGYTSSTQYNYDLGSVSRVVDPKKASVTTSYDKIGRVERVTNDIDKSYTRYVYPQHGLSIQTYQTIESTDEVFSEQVFDGAGRVISSLSEFPASTGGYTLQRTTYDILGRAVGVSNPVEVTSNGTPVGAEDSSWIWTRTLYDWMNRPVEVINPDGTSRRSEFSGCGCAGELVTTVTDENGRQKRMSTDRFGRLIRTEELKLDGSVYSTATFTYNSLDQLTSINHMGQVRIFSYDGFGRVKSRTTPEQGTISYEYNPDNTVRETIDARGARTSFRYNGRKLVEEISYQSPGNGVAQTAGVSFTYDAAGNRTLMKDGFGSVDYIYDTQSRLEREIRHITGIADLTVDYTYSLSGDLKSITTPWGAKIEYVHDKAGQVREVKGENYHGVSSYIKNIGYRAFGGVKNIEYGNNKSLNIAYDQRLRVTRWDVNGLIGSEYQYNDFGEKTAKVAHARNLYDSTLSRTYQYDHVGRLISATNRSNIFSQSVNYDIHGNIVGRQGSGEWSTNVSLSYSNNKIVQNPVTGAQMEYDSSGNMLFDGEQRFTYDVIGNQVTASGKVSVEHGYDGDGLRIKKVENGATTYYLRSSALGGQVIAELDSTGNWKRGYVYLGSQQIAIQDGGVYFVHQDPVTKSQRITDKNGNVVSSIEVDPWGVETSRVVNPAFQKNKFDAYERDANGWDFATHRTYSSHWGRFGQPDPIVNYSLSSPQSFNRNSYSFNDPINNSDPSGLDGLCFGGQCWDDGMGPVNVFAWPWSQSDFSGGGYTGPVGPTHRSMFGGFPGLPSMAGIINGPRFALPPGPRPMPHPTPTPDRTLAPGTMLDDGTYIQNEFSRNLYSFAHSAGADDPTFYLNPLKPGVAAIFNAAKMGLSSTGIINAAEGITHWNPLNGPGPLGKKVAATFRGASYTEYVTSEPTTLYRVYGGKATEFGPYWTRTPPAGPLQSRIDSGLLPEWGNSARKVTRIQVPPGTTIFEGFAAPQGGLIGGGNQVFIPRVDQSWRIK